ncbi:MAG: hypothetical protein AAF851_09230 [Myxococcota bacterium]
MDDLELALKGARDLLQTLWFHQVGELYDANRRKLLGEALAAGFNPNAPLTRRAVQYALLSMRALHR